MNLFESKMMHFGMTLLHMENALHMRNLFFL